MCRKPSDKILRVASIQRILLWSVLLMCVSGGVAKIVAQDQTKAFLRKVDYYKYSRVSFFEADSLLVTRMSDCLTPGLPRTPALEKAERECATTNEIIQRIKLKQNGTIQCVAPNQKVPDTLITIGEDAQSCETVKNYYVAMLGLVRIGRVYIITERYVKGTEPKILGVVGFKQPTPKQALDPDYVKNSVAAPIYQAVLDTADLKHFKTKEFEKDSSGATIPVKGSIESATTDNLYDYIKNFIMEKNPTDQIAVIRPQIPSGRESTTKTNTKAELPLTQNSSSSANVPDALKYLDEEAAPFLSRWTVCEKQVQKIIQQYFKEGLGRDPGTELSKISIWGEPKRNGKYELYQIQCGNAMVVRKEIEETMHKGMKDLIASPVTDEGNEAYCHDFIVVSRVGGKIEKKGKKPSKGKKPVKTK